MGGFRRKSFFFFFTSSLFLLSISASRSLSQHQQPASVNVQKSNMESQRTNDKLLMTERKEDGVGVTQHAGGGTAGGGASAGSGVRGAASGSGSGSGRGGLGGTTYGGGGSGSSSKDPYTPSSTNALPLLGAKGAGKRKSSADLNHSRVGFTAALMAAILVLLVTLV